MPVHRAGEADGLFYYVMDYFEGETLADRLKHGPLDLQEARKLGRDLLDALEAVHQLGVVHRDIKPSNILLIGGRAVLADFGISRVFTATTQGAATGPAGTLGYMPPEQAAGGEVTPRSDLYAVGIVLYEALTGRRWDALAPRAEWSRVPRRIVAILKRALAQAPEQRWPDAATFRRTLWHTRTTRYRRRTLLLTVSGLAVGAMLVWWLLRPQPLITEVAVIPFEAGPGADTAVARRLTLLAQIDLEDFFREMVTPHPFVRQWLAARQAAGNPISDSDLWSLRTKNAVTGRVQVADTGTVVDLTIVRQGGRVDSAGTVAVGSLEETGKRIGLNIVRTIAPNDVRRYPEQGVLRDVPDPALAAFLDGEAAFHRNAWRTAVEWYAAALAVDSSFALAGWRLSNAWRWLTTGTPSPAVELRRLASEQRPFLLDLDRRLIDAQLATTMTERLRRYEEAIRRYPLNGYAAFLYADELMHRGAFVGVALDSVLGALAAAVGKDSSLGPAVDHLVWGHIRMGNRDSSERWLTRLRQVTAGPEEVEISTPPLLHLAFVERFDPSSAATARQEIVRDPMLARLVASAFRLGAMLGVPGTQWELGAMLAENLGDNPTDHASVLVGQGMALVALGRSTEALQRFDSAAALWDSGEARLQAAEWRVLLPILGLPGVPSAEIDVGRSILRNLTSDPVPDSRAAWVLGLDAIANGDARGFSRSARIIHSAGDDTLAVRLGMLLEAVHKASRGWFDEALTHSEPLLALDSAGRGGDPFARAVLHMKRAEWLDSLERFAAADSAQLWYENFDFIGLPHGDAQASEIDWAVGTYAMWLRGERAHRLGSWSAACNHLGRAIELWSAPDSAYEPSVRLATEHAREACQR
jgi:tetratricopeptide (TPR) repeat protein